jgi:hypothetical protein
MYNLSACCFVRDFFKGAFCTPETIAQFLPFCEEMVIMDLGSTDGTLEFLMEISKHNHKISIISEGSFPHENASVFADLANELIAFCRNENILYWQSDEVWHEDLLKLMQQRFEQEQFDMLIIFNM